jgi:hypothetical protein
MDAAISIAQAVEPELASLGWFLVLWLACCLSALTISGMLPLRARSAKLATLANAGLVVGNLTCLFLLLTVNLRVSTIILFGGLVFLFMPAVFQMVPDRWRDSHAGLAVLFAIQTAILVNLYQLSYVFDTLYWILAQIGHTNWLTVAVG